jgi:hypothetical protein
MCFGKKKKAAAAPEPEKTKEETGTREPVAETTTPLRDPTRTSDPYRPIGTTSVTPTTIIKEPDAATVEQERLAQAELRQKRIERARSKQSLIKKRLERMQEYGSGKKVLTGLERELGEKSMSSLIAPASGKRRGTGRRSLLTGSTGGIGFYSRYL